MQAFPALTRSGVRPARSAGWVTRRHSGLLRSLIAGQANAILVARRHGAESLGAVTVSAPRRERRVCQAVRVDDRIVVGNTHLSHSAPIEEQDVELARCVAFLEGIARDEEALVLAGDLNRHAPTIDSFSAGADGIDHVLVRGAAASPAVIWAEEERTLGGRVLSDHAPVEVVVE